MIVERYVLILNAVAFFIQSSGCSHIVCHPPKKAYAVRQVSVGEKRPVEKRHSFDSLGDNGYVRNLAHVDSIVDKRKKSDFPMRSEVRQDTEENLRSNDERSGYYDHKKQGEELPTNYSPSHLHPAATTNDRPPMPLTKRNDRRGSVIVTPRKQHLSPPKNENYYAILRSRARVFTEFSFLLPGLKMYVMEYVSANKRVSTLRINYILIA